AYSHSGMPAGSMPPFCAANQRTSWTTCAIPSWLTSPSKSTVCVSGVSEMSVATAGHLADGLVCDGVAASLPRLVVPLGTLRDRLKRVVVDHGGLLSGCVAVSGHWGGWRSRRVRQRTSPRRWRRGRG